MNKSRRVVRFALSHDVECPQVPRVRLTSERELETSRVGVWLGLAAILWSLIAIPAFMM